MESKLSTFHIILLFIFGAGGVAGMIAFASYRGSQSGDLFPGTITIWGTMPEENFINFMNDATQKVSGGGLGLTGDDIVYVEVQEKDFEHIFLEAVVSGTGPDVLFLPHTMLATYADKLFPLQYDFYPARQFRDNFIEIGEIYLTASGIYGFPVVVDPLVMYWNRNHYTQAGLLKPPMYWDEFLQISPKLTQTDGAANISKSALAFGEFANVTHAKNILSLLIMQAGNPIISGDLAKLEPVIANQSGLAVSPAESAVRFFIDFANPVKPVYTWNRSLAESKSAFLSDDLATYFGFASELEDLKAKNANLNFDVSMVPQARDVGTRLAYATVYGFSLVKSSPRISDAYRMVAYLTEERAIGLWSEVTGLSPARRSLLVASPEDPFRAVVYDSTIVARTWIDPDPSLTDDIFQSMVEASATGRLRTSAAIRRAENELTQLLQ